MSDIKTDCRTIWIDELRAILFVIICLSHLLQSSIPTSVFSHLATDLTAYAVGGFFLISGYLSRLRTQDFRSFLLRKTKSLLIPYFVLSLLTAILSPYILSPSSLTALNYPRWDLLSHNTPPHLQAVCEWFAGDIICTLIGAGSRQTQPLWFVFDLFVVQLAYFILRNKLKISNTAILIFSFLVATILDMYALNIPFIRLGAKFMGIAFVSAGALLRINIKGGLSTFTISLAIAIVSYITFDRTCHFVHNSFGGKLSLLYFITVVTVMYSCFYIFPILSTSRIRIQAISNCLRFISINSIYILGLHFYFMTIFNTLLYNNLHMEEGILFLTIVTFTILGTLLTLPIIKKITTLFQGLSMPHASLILR